MHKWLFEMAENLKFANEKMKRKMKNETSRLLAIKVVVRAEILPRDFLQTSGNYYFSLTAAKIQRLKKFGQFLKALTMKLSTFKNKRTSHPEILIKVFR